MEPIFFIQRTEQELCSAITEKLRVIPQSMLIKAFDSAFERPGFVSLEFVLCAGGQATLIYLSGVSSEKLYWAGVVFVSLAEGGSLSSKEYIWACLHSGREELVPLRTIFIYYLWNEARICLISGEYCTYRIIYPLELSVDDPGSSTSRVSALAFSCVKEKKLGAFLFLQLH